ncbi:Glyoxylate/hydroxypyruvate reductase A [Defluviimonas aquaemixtae]|uniref:Glyoxylate/hydroxypyruvate reductase A n=1 Tax=Albidovulum aquaemixtae TaxID=1542388 RepID=A0A2R8BLV8_9RHOB|nr:glyoxylate/hydroxypyruvate reductase A [Defluviimonas aquaemixtae]SPH24313.1 Glyoxylate/hydroxypyruvate reductase A [Defluviimonas aquaemixtae]
MSVTVFFAAGEDRWPDYRDHLSAAIAEAGVNARVVLDATPEEADYIVFAPGGPIEDFRPYRNAKAVLNLWAGVENIVGNATLTQPLCRMVDPALTAGMVEWVTGHVLRHHLGMDVHILGQNGIWRGGIAPPIASERPVAILGLGELGRACGRALAGLGFPVMGWSRTAKAVPGLDCHAKEEGLRHVLSRAEIAVLLLPLTAETDTILNADRIASMPRGAIIINPGRGALIDDDALLAALDAGQIGHATLDVFREEPLPPSHPFWQHPKITVTPHIASETRGSSASRVIAENIRRGEAGESFLYLVDRRQGY